MAQSLPAAAAEPELAEAAAALTRWRDTRPLGGRIPEALWSRAVELASRHGVAQVARVLRLDYVRLKRRLRAHAEASAPPPPSSAFLDMTLDLAPAGSGCVLVLTDTRGRSLRIEWTRGVASEVAAVARSLWEASA
jgi:hypothetical protein